MRPLSGAFCDALQDQQQPTSSFASPRTADCPSNAPLHLELERAVRERSRVDHPEAIGEREPLTFDRIVGEDQQGLWKRFWGVRKALRKADRAGRRLSRESRKRDVSEIVLEPLAASQSFV